ncbi:MAG: transporter substrate-binding domain-containing protein, partial [Acidovorax sp.]
ALASGRADAYLAPNGIAAHNARDGKTKLVGTFSGGWPQAAEIAVTSRKGSGIADAITAALNAQIKNGNYAKALERWNLQSEAIQVSRTNPPGLPKK